MASRKYYFLDDKLDNISIIKVLNSDDSSLIEKTTSSFFFKLKNEL
jgi:hypothetical protein